MPVLNTISPAVLLLEPNEVPSKVMPFSITSVALPPILGLPAAAVDLDAAAPLALDDDMRRIWRMREEAEAETENTSRD